MRLFYKSKTLNTSVILKILTDRDRFRLGEANHHLAQLNINWTDKKGESGMKIKTIISRQNKTWQGTKTNMKKENITHDQHNTQNRQSK